MTATAEHLASVTELRPARRRPARPVAPVPPPAPSDLDILLRTALNRLLAESLARTEATAQDALDNLVGALLNTLKPGVNSLSKADLLALVERTANRLGCPPPARAGSDRSERVDVLAQSLADYPTAFGDGVAVAVAAARAFRDTRTDADWGALWTAAGDLHDELGVTVAVGR